MSCRLEVILLCAITEFVKVRECEWGHFNEGLLDWLQSTSLLGFAKGPIACCQWRFSGQMTTHMPQMCSDVVFNVHAKYWLGHVIISGCTQWRSDLCGCPAISATSIISYRRMHTAARQRGTQDADRGDSLGGPMHPNVRRDSLCLFHTTDN